MMIGFGSTEIKYEQEIEGALFNYAEELYSVCEQSYFDDELIENFKKHVDSLAVNSRNKADAYKMDAEHPDRYSSFYAYVLGDCNYLMVNLSFSHINRRHAMSPDGWAMMSNKRCVAIDSWDAGRSKRVRDAA